MNNKQSAISKFPSKGSKSSWPKIRKHSVGNHDYWLVDLGYLDGRRMRRTFKTKAEAELAALEARAKKKDEGLEAFALPRDLRIDALRARKVLPDNFSLYEAAEYYLQNVVKFSDKPPVKKIVAELIASVRIAVERGEKRNDTLRDLECRLKKFTETFGERQLNSITSDELERWFNADKDLSPRSRINYMNKVSRLYRFAIRKDYASVNLVATRIDRPRAPSTAVRILTVPQAMALLQNANGKMPEGAPIDLLPFVALGLFAGLRTAEIKKLDWSAVKFQSKTIRVDSAVAKKGKQRAVPMEDALLAWLSGYEGKTGPVVDGKNLRRRWDYLRKLAISTLKEAGGDAAKDVSALVDWPNNGLRHSYGSYHYAKFNDPVRTSTYMGHETPKVFHAHYKAILDDPQQAERYWAMRPENFGDKIVSITAA